MVEMRFAEISRERPRPVGRVGHPEELASAGQIDAYVGRRLRARRTELGVSQGRLGRQLGLTFSQVQKYEKGSNRIGAGRLYQLASILDVPVHYFFDGLDGRALEIQSRMDVPGAEEAARIQDLFARISDPNARKALLSLASSMVSG